MTQAPIRGGRDHLSKRGFAYWFMDDGGPPAEGVATNLNTQAFKKEEVETLCKVRFG